MMKHATALALALGAVWLATAGSAAAAEAKLSAEYDRCIDKSEGVTVAMRDCIAAEQARQDRSLNAAYKSLMTVLEPKRREMLRAAERAWLDYRKTECEWQGSAEMGGTAEAVIVDDCWVGMTADRAQTLADAVKAERESH